MQKHEKQRRETKSPRGKRRKRGREKVMLMLRRTRKLCLWNLVITHSTMAFRSRNT